MRDKEQHTVMKPQGESPERDARRERQKDALRDNLRRRKEAAASAKERQMQESQQQ